MERRPSQLFMPEIRALPHDARLVGHTADIFFSERYHFNYWCVDSCGRFGMYVYTGRTSEKLFCDNMGCVRYRAKFDGGRPWNERNWIELAEGQTREVMQQFTPKLKGLWMLACARVHLEKLVQQVNAGLNGVRELVELLKLDPKFLKELHAAVEKQKGTTAV